MPGDSFGDNKYIWGSALFNAIPSEVPQSRLDDMVRRILASWYYLAQDTNYPKTSMNSWKGGTGGPNVQGSNKDIARAVARDGIVLLKNENAALPLKSPKSLAIIGQDAFENPDGMNACPDRNCDNGTLAMGWGSGTAEYAYLIAPYDAIKARAAKEGTTITKSSTDSPSSGATAAQAAETALVFINADSGEEYVKVEGKDADRANLDPWHNGNDLVAAVAKTGKPTIVVIHSVGPIILEKILGLKSVVAIVWAGLPGQESGNALVDVLYGDVSPSGKLPYTIAKEEKDYGVEIMKGKVDKFKEGIYVDYRQFDKKGITPRYEFGFGLCKSSNLLLSFVRLLTIGMAAYTTFTYSAPKLTQRSEKRSSCIPVINTTSTKQTQVSLYAKHGPTISTTIINTGNSTGAEVAQLYLSFPKQTEQNVDFPPWQLRGFKKVWLKPGESKTVNFSFRKKDLSFWDVRRQEWVVVKGEFQGKVAGSSREKGVSVEFEV